MTALLVFLNILVTLSMSPAEQRLGEAGLMARQNVRLESEIELAGKKSTYFVVDLALGEVDVKARGVVLKSIPIRKSRRFGARPGASALVVLSKNTLLEPSREEVRPGAEPQNPTDDAFDIQALEVSDMPTSYNFKLDGGLVLRVVPAPDSLSQWPGALMVKARAALLRPFMALARAVIRRDYMEVEISLSKSDAQALYWHLGEGMSVIVLV